MTKYFLLSIFLINFSTAFSSEINIPEDFLVDEVSIEKEIEDVVSKLISKRKETGIKKEKKFSLNVNLNENETPKNTTRTEDSGIKINNLLDQQMYKNDNILIFEFN